MALAFRDDSHDASHMTDTSLKLAVIMERRLLHNKWASVQWEAVAVVPGVAEETAPQCLRRNDACAQWLFPGHSLRLYRDEAENYLLNVTAPEPRVFVMWRQDREDEPRPVILSVSYGEAARMMDSGEQVDGVPMPADICGWVTQFARQHYRAPEKKPKRFASSKLDNHESGEDSR